MVQPFVKKCHPDMARQQGLSPRAQDINLRAIQSLNEFVDGVVAMDDGTKNYPFDSMLRGRKYEDEPMVVQIDFVMSFDTSKSAHTPRKKAVPTTSQRSVELQVPPPTMDPSMVNRHAQRQFAKLLQVADLPSPDLTIDDDHFVERPHPKSSQNENFDIKNLDERAMDQWAEHLIQQDIAKKYGGSDERYRQFLRNARPQPHKTEWERSRDAFLANIDWDKVRELNEQLAEDERIKAVTAGVIRNDPALRRDLLSKILENVRVNPKNVTPLEQLVAMRRIFRLLDQNFDELDLESSGKFWENILTIIVTKARTYNTSPTALYKRRKKKLSNGFSFKIHHDDRVTVRMPADFSDSEFVEELSRNLKDFHEWNKREFDIFKS